MANTPNGNGRSVSTPDENRASWRPQDTNGRADERAMGQSGYNSGRYGDDRSLDYQPRNQGYTSASMGQYDEDHSRGDDDRWTGRGGQQMRDTYGQRETGYGYQGYGSESSGYGSQRDDRGFDQGPRSYGQGFGMGSTGSRGYDQGGRNPDNYDQSFSGRGNEGNYQQSGYGRDNQGGHSQQGYGRNSYGQSSFGQGGEQRFGQDQNRVSHRGKGPAGYQRSDERIKELVSEALSDDHDIDATHIEVMVKDGAVTLSGTVEDRRMKRAAEDLIESLAGVKDVENKIRVSADRSSSAAASTKSSIGAGTGGQHTIDTSSKKHQA